MVDMASTNANDSAADWELTIAVPVPECGYQLPEREVPRPAEDNKIKEINRIELRHKKTFG